MRRIVAVAANHSRHIVAIILLSTFLVGMCGCASTTSDIPSSQMAPQSTGVIPAPWVPNNQIAPVPMSDSEKFALREKYLNSEATGLGLIDPPKVDLIRWTSQADWGSTMAQCLQDAGFNAEGAGEIITYPDGISDAQKSA